MVHQQPEGGFLLPRPILEGESRLPGSGLEDGGGGGVEGLEPSPLGPIQTAVEETTTLSHGAERDRMGVLKAIAESFNGVGEQKAGKRARIKA